MVPFFANTGYKITTDRSPPFGLCTSTLDFRVHFSLGLVPATRDISVATFVSQATGDDPSLEKVIGAALFSCTWIVNLWYLYLEVKEMREHQGRTPDRLTGGGAYCRILHKGYFK